MTTLHAHKCEACGEFPCTRPQCPMGRIITHRGHERELTRLPILEPMNPGERRNGA